MQLERDTILEVTQGELPGSQAAWGEGACRPATSLCWDSRQAGPGSLFAAMPGERVDGYDFIADVASKGAAGILAQRPPEAGLLDKLRQTGTWLVLVDDVMSALGRLAAHWRGCLGGRVVALTGSSGKTTTKNLVRDCLAAQGRVCATLANQNNELGVPATILAADADTEFIVVEMGMRGLGQISSLCEVVRPDVALVTNVGTSHIELLGSQDAIARAKAEVFAGLADGGLALLNSSEPHLGKLMEYGQLAKRNMRTLFYDGSGADPDSYEPAVRPSVFARDVDFDDEGRPSFLLCSTVAGPLQSARCSMELRGAHNVQNALAAAAVGLSCGMDVAQVAQALAASQPEHGRQDVLVAQSGLRVVDDSYNANPDSMRASLASFSKMKVAGRRIAVLGDMGELGAYAREGHELVGGLAAGASLDALVCVGQLARTIAQAASDAGMDARAVSCVDDAQHALEALAGLQPALGLGDCVLVKASHSMGLEAVAKGLVE